jgi:hypothetical protein
MQRIRHGGVNAGRTLCNWLASESQASCKVSQGAILRLKGYLGNWPHYYRVIRSKLVFYNVLTTSINNTHIKRLNSKTICSSETFSSRIFGSAPNTLYHLFDLVGLTLLWHSHRRAHSDSSTFTFFKLANCTHVACRYTSRATLATQCSAASQSQRYR